MSNTMKWLCRLGVVAAVVLAVAMTEAARGQGLVSVRPGGIFVPRPKGAGETLDDTKTIAAAEQADVVTTGQGDRLLGTVGSMDSGGKLRLSGPQFGGDVAVLASAVDSIAFKGSDKPSGRDEVILTNGDRLIGTISSITEEAVSLDTEAAGPLKLSAKFLRAISFGQSETTLIESGFALGRMEPWTARGATYSIVDSAVVCRNHGNMAPLVAKLEQKEAVTMVAKVQALEGNPLQVYLVLFSDSPGNAGAMPFGRSSLYAMFNNSEVSILCANGGSDTMGVGGRGLNRSVTGGTLRLAYDPASGKARAWLDSEEIGEFQVPIKLTSGQFVAFNSVDPVRISSLTVLRGIVPPTGDDDLPPASTEEGGATIQFINRDRVSATHITLADGQMSFKTSYSDAIKCSVKTVGRLVFSDKGREEPRRQAGDVQTLTSVGRLTFQFEQLTADRLLGRSDYLGTLSLKRSAVREIRFNPYRP
jgi:hypothetical protein